MESHYSLNIAIRTDRRAWDSTPKSPKYQIRHYARVDLGRDKESAMSKAAEFTARFPDGTTPGTFELSLTYWKGEISRVPIPRKTAVLDSPIT